MGTLNHQPSQNIKIGIYIFRHVYFWTLTVRRCAWSILKLIMSNKLLNIRYLIENAFESFGSLNVFTSYLHVDDEGTRRIY